MNRPLARYRPSRRYLAFSALAALACGCTAWAGTHWGLAWTISAALFLLTSLASLMLALRPAVEVHEAGLLIGRQPIPWREIARVDRVIVSERVPLSDPLILNLTLSGGRVVTLLHTGNADSCIGLMQHVYRFSRAALLDGTPYREFWNDAPVARNAERQAGKTREQSRPAASAPPVALPRPRLLLAEDEEEVERLFQQLKKAGRMDKGGPAPDLMPGQLPDQIPGRMPDQIMDQHSDES